MRSFKLNFLHSRRNRFTAHLSGFLVLLLCCCSQMIMAQPANDLCANALPIICDATVTGNNSTATNAGAPAFCGTTLSTSRGMWYSWTGDGQTVTVSTCNPGSNFDTKLGVFSGACGALNCVGGDDDDFACGFSQLRSTVTFASVVGTPYLFYVAGFNSNSVGNFELSLATPICPPANDLCAGAAALNPDGTTVNGTTANATSTGAVICAGVDVGTDGGVWYSVAIPAGPDGDVQVDVTNLPAGTAADLAVYTGGCGALTCVGGNSDLPGPSFTFPATAGTTYTIYVEDFDFASTPITFDVGATFTPDPPANDLCAGALPIACGGTVMGATNDGATANDATPCNNAVDATPGVWYTWTGNGDIATFSTCNAGTDYDSQIAVFSGSCTALTCVAGENLNPNDANCGGLPTFFGAEVVFPSTAGTDYFILVSGFATNTGTFELSLDCCPPITIDAVTATGESCDGTADGTITVAATGGAGATLEYSIDGFATSNTTGVFTGLADGTFDVEVRYQGDVPCALTVGPAESPLLDDVAIAPGLVNCGELSISDPCTCNNDATPIDLDAGTGGDDGTFSETVSVPAAPFLLPPGLIFTVAPDDNMFTFTRDIDVPIGTQLTFVPDPLLGPALGTYEVDFNHVDNVGYVMVVEGPFAPGNPVNVFLTINNLCAYPNPTFDGAFPGADICATAAPIPLGAVDTDGAAPDPGSPTFSITGVGAVTTIDPAALGAGTYQVNLSFDAADDGNGGVSPGGGVPARPGCVQTAFQNVTIRTAPTIDNIVATDESCDGANDGTITVTAGGGGNYFYYLTEPGTFNLIAANLDGNFTNLPDGDYLVNVENLLATGDAPPFCPVTAAAATTIAQGVNCDITITDPCSCNNDATVIDLDAGTGGADGTFNETVTIGSAAAPLPAGLTFTVVAANPAPAPGNPGTTILAGTTIGIGDILVPGVVPGTYDYTFTHTDAIGYNIVIEGPQPSPNVNNLFFEIGNNCSYPNPAFFPALPATANCAVPGVIALNAFDQLLPPPPPGSFGNGSDFLGFTVTGPGLAAPLAVNSIDPAVLGQGTFTVLMTFDGDADANGGIAPPGGTALPGCIQTVQQQIVITCAPPNDLCANALPIACGGTVTGTTTFATNTGAPAACIPNFNTSGGVWYTWIGDGSNATFSTCGANTNFDTQIAVTSGGCAVAPTCVGGNDDDGFCAANGSIFVSSFSFLSTVGTTYHIYVTGFAGNTGTFDLSLTCCAPPVAVCSNATVVLSAANPGAGVLTAAMVNGGSTAGCGGLALAITAGQTVYSCADVGAGNQQIVTLTATDAFGNTSTCNATVTTEDQTTPTVTCNNVTVQLDANGIGTLTAAAVLNTAVDNCSTPAQLAATGQLTQSAFNCGELGANVVTLSVTDVNGLTGTCNAAVTVQDMVAPVAVCQDITVQLDAAGNAAITGAQLNNGSTDACGPLAFAANPNAFTCANVGTNNVVLTVTDGSNNAATCISVVTVEDNVAPIATCQNVVVMLDANGMGSTTAAAVNNGSFDACGVTLALSQTDFDCDDIGANPVTLTVTDPSGNSATCTATVTVQDNIPAVILCRAPVNTVNDPGVCGADVILLPPLVLDENCSIANIARAPAAGAILPTGTTVVTWTLTDAGGNATTCTQNVTVNDTQAPAITCPDSFVAYTSWDNCGYPASVMGAPTAMDNCPGVVITADATNQNFYAPGHYMRGWTATDAAGNTATCMQWVSIYDTTLPQLSSCPDDIEVNATTTTGANVNWANPTGIDNCAGPIILVEANGFASGDFFPLGDTEISYNLYDQNGQFVQCEFTVSVVAAPAPLNLSLTCMDDLNISLQNAMGWAAFGWNPPLMETDCEQCETLASDDFETIGTLKGHQYYTHTATPMTFAEAIAYAENVGAAIAVLEDKKEVPMIANELPEGNYFIGLIDAEGTDEFAWTNGDEFVQANFGQNFENLSGEPAVVILNEEGEWEVVLMADATANFVFEKVCVELGMEIIEETNDIDPEIAETNSTAQVQYLATDPCGNTAACGFEVVLVEETVAYCEPTGIATDDENPFFIESFSLNDYIVESGDDNGYGNYSNENFLFEPGEVLSMEAIFAGPSIDEVPMYVRVWMDLNADGDFFDEGELVMQGVDVSEIISELTIPNINHNVENTVMRIAISRLTYAESCGDFLNGEVEDYTISILQPENSVVQGGNGSGLNTIGSTQVDADMLIYPNPAQDEMFVKLSNVVAETATLRIFNSVGQLIEMEKVASTATIRLDVSAYTNGLYSITVEADGQVFLTQKFVIEK